MKLNRRWKYKPKHEGNRDAKKPMVCTLVILTADQTQLITIAAAEAEQADDDDGGWHHIAAMHKIVTESCIGITNCETEDDKITTGAMLCEWFPVSELLTEISEAIVMGSQMDEELGKP